MNWKGRRQDDHFLTVLFIYQYNYIASQNIRTQIQFLSNSRCGKIEALQQSQQIKWMMFTH